MRVGKKQLVAICAKKNTNTSFKVHQIPLEAHPVPQPRNWTLSKNSSQNILCLLASPMLMERMDSLPALALLISHPPLSTSTGCLNLLSIGAGLSSQDRAHHPPCSRSNLGSLSESPLAHLHPCLDAISTPTCLTQPLSPPPSSSSHSPRSSIHPAPLSITYPSCPTHQTLPQSQGTVALQGTCHSVATAVSSVSSWRKSQLGRPHHLHLHHPHLHRTSASLRPHC